MEQSDEERRNEARVEALIAAMGEASFRCQIAAEGLSLRELADAIVQRAAQCALEPRLYRLA
jgi:hypothetical protein